MKSSVRQFDRRTPPAEMIRRRRALGGGGNYEVIGRDGVTRYHVEVYEDGTVLCDCEGYRHGKVCWHAVRAMKRWLAERMAVAS